MFQYFSKSKATILQGPERSLFNYGWKNLNERFGGAVCVPSSCLPQIVRKLIRSLLNGSDFEAASDFDQKDFCKTKKTQKKFSRKFIGLWISTAILLVCAISSSIYDHKTRSFKERSDWLLAFSLVKNGSSLFNLKQQSSDTIKCLDCLRFLSAVSIVCLHLHFHRVLFPVQNPEEISRFTNSLNGRNITGLTVSVDTFFVLSGLLVTRSILKSLNA